VPAHTTKSRHLFRSVALSALVSMALAQNISKSAGKQSVETCAKLAAKLIESRLLSTDEGLAIIVATFEIRHSTHSNDDCSHLVHAIYEVAGFPYRYADSFQLYNGVEEFRQVTHPQPGDLAVWRGHAAIVISPAQQAFFSSTSSGFGIESYGSQYWKHRGNPRFFRYCKAASLRSHSETRTTTAKGQFCAGSNHKNGTP